MARAPRFTSKNYGAYARRAMGRDWADRGIAYQMSNGRQFKDDAGVGGVYVAVGGAPRLLEDGSLRLDEDESVRLCE